MLAGERSAKEKFVNDFVRCVEQSYAALIATTSLERCDPIDSVLILSGVWIGKAEGGAFLRLQHASSGCGPVSNC